MVTRNPRNPCFKPLLPDHPSKAQYAAKYEWTLKHPESCECLYCVAMQTISEKYEVAQRAHLGKRRMRLA